MLITNLIVALFCIAIQVFNAHILTKNARLKNTFFHYNIIPNTFVNDSIRPFKKKVLSVGRIYLVITLVVSILFIFLNNSLLFLYVYILFAVIGAILAPKIAITINMKEIKKLDIILTDKNSKLMCFGLLYNDKNDKNMTYQYGYYRSALNIANTKSKALLAVLVLIIGIGATFAYKSLGEAKTTTNNTSSASVLTYTLKDTSLVVVHPDLTTTIDLASLIEFKVIDTMPATEKNISGKQLNDYRIGQYKLQGSDAPVYLIVQAKSNLLLELKTPLYTYYMSFGSKKQMDDIVNQLTTFQATHKAE